MNTSTNPLFSYNIRKPQHILTNYLNASPFVVLQLDVLITVVLQLGKERLYIYNTNNDLANIKCSRLL